MQPAWFFFANAIVLSEVIVYFARPQWLTRLAVIALVERRFTLNGAALRSRRADAPAGYRDASPAAPSIPALPPRTALSDSVLFASGPNLALRRAFGFGSRVTWLLAITLERDGDDIVLRPKQALFPLSIALIFLLLGITSYGKGQIIMAVMMPVAIAIAFGGQYFFAGSRDAQLEEALSFVETEARRQLEEPAAP